MDELDQFHLYVVQALHSLPRQALLSLDALHNQSVRDFNSAMARLFGPQQAFQGRAADAIAELVGRYLQAEQGLCRWDDGGPSVRIGGALAASDSLLSQLEPLLRSIREQLTRFQSLLTATRQLPETPAQPGSAEPPPEGVPDGGPGMWPFLLVAGSLLAGAEYENWLMQPAFDLLSDWKRKIQGLGGEPLPPLPGDPVQISAAVTLDLPFVIPYDSALPKSARLKDLSPEQLAQLASELGVSEAFIRELLSIFGDLTVGELVILWAKWRVNLQKFPRLRKQLAGDSLDQLWLIFVAFYVQLSKYAGPEDQRDQWNLVGRIVAMFLQAEQALSKVEPGQMAGLEALVGQCPQLVKLLGAGGLMLWMLSLAFDPAQKKLQLREVEVAFWLAEHGKVSLPITRDASGAGEFVDGTGRVWDIKSYQSASLGQGVSSFDLDRVLGDIRAELEEGEGVVIDTSGLSSEDLGVLRERLLEASWYPRYKDDICWYP